MKEIRSLDVKSIFKVSAVIGAIVGVVLGFILMMVSFFDKRFLEGFVTFILAPILYGLMGALTNALIAWIYNKAVPRVGGLRLYLEDADAPTE